MRPAPFTFLLGLIGLAAFTAWEPAVPPSSPPAPSRSQPLRHEKLSATRAHAAEPAFAARIESDPDAALAWFREQTPSQAAALARGLPEDIRASWLTAAFRRLAEDDPDAALAALPTDASRPGAWKGLLEGWAEREPAALTLYADPLPDGPERDDALATALPAWCQREPEAFALWLNGIRGETDYDRAVALLVTHTDTLSRPNSLALSWVEGMMDPALRRGTALAVLRQWAASDLSAAVNYIEKAPWIEETTRPGLLLALFPPPDPE